jgi:hypothetical protein
MRSTCFLVLLSSSILLTACRNNNRKDTLPSILLHTKEWVNFNNYVLGEAVYMGDTLKAYFKLRGGNSVRYEKTSLSMDIGFDFPFNQKTGTNRWILNANYIDKTLMRHKIAYDLFKEMDPANSASSCSYIHLYRNGNYQGIYVLMQRLTEKTLGVQEGGYVFKEPDVFRENIHPIPLKTQKYPERTDSTAVKELLDFQHFLHHADQRLFDAKIFEHIDIQSFADWYLLLLFSNNGDGVLKNFYLYKTTKNNKLRIAPWDYDHSWGRDGDNEKNSVPDIGETRSVLFQKLLKNETFLTYVTERWRKHQKNNVLTPSNFEQHIKNNRAVFIDDLEKNTTLWPHDANWYFDNSGFEKELELMSVFVQENHKELENRFGS